MDWKVFWNLFLTDKSIYYEFVGSLDEKMFQDGVMTNLMILSRKFSDKYKTNPDIDTLRLMLGTLPEDERKRQKMYDDFLTAVEQTTTTVNREAFTDEVFRAAQTYEMEKFVLRTANKIEGISLEETMGDLRGIMLKFKAKSLGVDVTDAKKIIPAIRYQPTDKVSTGMPCLDHVLYGGWGINEISIVMAPPGRGKSAFLLNAMYNAMMSGYTVLYITLELSEAAVARRLYSRIAYAKRKDMLDEAFLEKVATRFFTLSRSRGRVLYQASRSLTVERVEAIIDQLKLQYDFTPDLLIVDYLDLLAPRASDYREENRYKLRAITDDLRSISLRKNIAVLTATQANREALKKKKITEANVSESFGKVEVSDVIMAICQTEEEFKMQRARLAILKNRDNMSGASLEMHVDFEKMCMMDLDLAFKLGVLETPEGTADKKGES